MTWERRRPRRPYIVDVQSLLPDKDCCLYSKCSSKSSICNYLYPLKTPA